MVCSGSFMLMRMIAFLAACLLLAGCPAGKAPETTSPRPVERPVPSGPSLDFEGIWTTKDKDGEVFDIQLFPNGQAVTNWSKGSERARGERGFWRKEGGRLIAVYSDGWTNTLDPVNGGVWHKGYAPGTAIESNPTNQAEASRMDGPTARFVGIWRMNREPDGSFLYVALLSNGRAFSTINRSTEGTWTVTEKGALCSWPDEWFDLIEQTPEGWRKRSWVGADSGEPADVSPAIRVGETRFAIEP